jgi:hypothetical protein
VYTVCIEKSRDKRIVQYHLGKKKKNREKCERKRTREEIREH